MPMRHTLALPLAPASSSPTLTIHIYRNLLRQASYLPSVCQPYVRQQILSGFRRHAHDQPNCPATRRRIRRARHDLRYLFGANNGLLGNLQRILLLVFGRTGNRRRLLVHTLLRKEPPLDSTLLEAAIAQETEARTYTAKDGSLAQRPTDWLDKWDTRKLQALASSQARHGPAFSPRPEIKTKQLDPAARLPQLNIWARPLPATLARSKLRKEHVRLVNRVLPPMAANDWHTLRALALGHADSGFCQMPARRTPAMPGHPDNADIGLPDKSFRWHWGAYATEPMRSVERASSRSQRSRTTPQLPGPRGQEGAIGIHRYTPRSLRRLFAKIWEMAPTMETRPGAEGSWDIVWGKVAKDVPVAAAAHANFFEGAPVVTKTGNKKPRLN